MAYYAALVSAVQLLEDNVHRDRYGDFRLGKQQIASLYEKLSLMQASLEDYSGSKDAKAADFLERRIRDAAYKTQDIIESQYITESDQDIIEYQGTSESENSSESGSQISVHGVPPKYKSTHGVERCFSWLISIFQKAKLPHFQIQTPEEPRLLWDEVDSIVKEVMRIKKSQRSTEDLQLKKHYSADIGPSQQAASTSTNTMVGFENRLTTIKDQLCGVPSKLQVISIVGMGGIGKTTLARNIFNDELIVYHFYCRVWVTTSQDYYLRKILLGILDSLNINNEELSKEEDNALAEHIYKHLKGRRYLIIMDDIWDTKVWDDIKRIFPDDSNGSRVVLTTRLSDMALYPNSFGSLHQMQFLNDNQSWNLFCEKVFCHPELEDIGRLIAKSCRGLPLAIVVVAGLLSKVNKTIYDWEGIAINISSAASKDDEHFSKILSLSYSQLPHHIKPCYLYMGGFPEDYEIRVSKLIKLWVAEGFLKPIESKSLEEVGEEYLEDLVNRNLVLITKKRCNGKFKSCSIHDVLRDLCMERARYENFLCTMDEIDYLRPEVIRNMRRLYIHPTRTRVKKETEWSLHVRSVLYFSEAQHSLSFILKFELLRILDAQEKRFLLFPDQILELHHLRYLALEKFPIPASISKLQNLQTLRIEDEGLVVKFENLKIPHLRHVMISQIQLLPIPFAGEASILENLQTLSRVENFKFTNEIIRMIPNLKKLKAFYNERGLIWQKICVNNLVYLCQLETLDIWIFPRTKVPVDPFPESFAFPMKLKKLSLKGSRLPWKDMTVVGSLPELQVLKLREDAFVGEEWEPIEGEFPQLKFLLMDKLDLK